MKKYKKTLAIDYGTQRIGLAVSYESIAEPLQVIANDDASIANIIKIAKQEKADQILVGISENKTAEKTREFAKKLKAQTNLPIIYFDETLSSQEAWQKLKNSPAKKSKHSQPIDHLAASVILQEYLDYK